MTISTDTDRRIDRLTGDLPPGSSASSATSSRQSFFVSDATGSDLNDGSIDSPVQTITRVEQLIPDHIKHEINVFVEPHTGAGYTWPTFQARTFTGLVGIWVHFTSFTTLVSGDTAQGGSAIGTLVSSGGLTPDALEGKTIEILDGSAAGDRRTIAENTATNIIPNTEFTADPTGASFRVVEPDSSNRLLVDFAVPMVLGHQASTEQSFGSPAPRDDDYSPGVHITNAIIDTVAPTVFVIDARLSLFGCELHNTGGSVGYQGTGQLLFGRGSSWYRVTPPTVEPALSSTSWVGWGVNFTGGHGVVWNGTVPFIGGFVNTAGFWRQQGGLAQITGTIRGHLRCQGEQDPQDLSFPVVTFGRLAPFKSPRLFVGRIINADATIAAAEASFRGYISLGDEVSIESTTTDCIRCIANGELRLHLDVNIDGTNGANGIVVHTGGRLTKSASGSFDINGTLAGDEYQVGERPVTGGGGTINGDLTASGQSITGARPEWDTGVVVTANAVTLTLPGHVIAVEGTTGSSTGPKQLQFSASPAAGFVRVEYSAIGIATLTFEATDAITAAAILVQIEDDGSLILNV